MPIVVCMIAGILTFIAGIGLGMTKQLNTIIELLNKQNKTKGAQNGKQRQ